MKNTLLACLCVVGCAAMAMVDHASADEVKRVLVETGDWSTRDHAPGATEQADACTTNDDDGVVILHFDAGDDGGSIVFRTSNEDWSLPANVSGVIEISIDGQTTDLKITDNTHDMVEAEIDKDGTLALLDAMGKAKVVTVKAGKSAPTKVSLDGMQKALTAFRTCSGVGGSSGGGANPFN